MAPINLPDGTEVSEVILPDGSTASEVIAPDGTTVFGAIPDSVAYQLDATKLDGFSDGDTVNNWTEVVTSTELPGSGTYRTSAINNNPGVDLDGTDDGFADSSFSNVPDEMTVFFLGNWDKNKVQTFTGRNVDNTGTSIIEGAANGDGTLRTNLAGSTFDSPGGLVGPTGVYLITVRLSESANEYILRVDGTQEDSASPSSVPELQALSVGFDDGVDGPRRHFNGDVGILEIHDEALPDSELSDREQTIADRFAHAI